MSLLKSYQVAWEGLTLNKGRSVLTALGVIIGVAAVIVMLAVSAGAEAEIADQINALGANLIMVMAPMNRGGLGAGADTVSLEYGDIAAIEENVSGVNGVSAEQSTTQDVKAGTITLESISILGTKDPRSVQLIRQSLDETKDYLRVRASVAWTQPLYQYANRLADLEKEGIIRTFNREYPDRVKYVMPEGFKDFYEQMKPPEKKYENDILGLY